MDFTPCCYVHRCVCARVGPLNCGISPVGLFGKPLWQTSLVSATVTPQLPNRKPICWLPASWRETHGPKAINHLDRTLINQSQLPAAPLLSDAVKREMLSFSWFSWIINTTVFSDIKLFSLSINHWFIKWWEKKSPQWHKDLTHQLSKTWQ